MIGSACSAQSARRDPTAGYTSAADTLTCILVAKDNADRAQPRDDDTFGPTARI